MATRPDGAPLDAQLARLDLGHEWTVSLTAWQITLDGPPVVDVTDPDSDFTTELALDLDCVGYTGRNPHTSLAGAIGVTIAAALVDCAHEFAEWARFDGIRVLAPHSTAWAEWDTLAYAGQRASRRFLGDHPYDDAFDQALLGPVRRPKAAPGRPDDETWPTSIDGPDPYAATGRLDELVARLELYPTQNLAIYGYDAVLTQPDVPDATGTNETFMGDLTLAVDWFDERLVDDRGTTGPATGYDACRLAAAMVCADRLHELAEWLRVDGTRVFDPHPDRGLTSFEAIAPIAWAWAADICTRHPRPTYTG